MIKMLKSSRLRKMNKFTKVKNNAFAVLYQFKKLKKINMYENEFKCI